MNTESSDQTLIKLCEIQQLQLEKLDEISRQLAESTEAAKRIHEEYERQGAAYERSLIAYQSPWRGIIIAVMLGLIAVAILIS